MLLSGALQIAIPTLPTFLLKTGENMKWDIKLLGDSRYQMVYESKRTPVPTTNYAHTHLSGEIKNLLTNVHFNALCFVSYQINYARCLKGLNILC